MAELIDVPVYCIIRLITSKKTGMPEYNFVQEALLECQQNFDIGICVTESAGLNHYDKKFCAALLRANKPVIFVVPNAHDFRLANDEVIKEATADFYQRLSTMDSFGLSKESLSNIKIFYTFPVEFDTMYQGEKSWLDECRYAEEVKAYIRKINKEGLIGLKETIHEEVNKVLSEE